MRFDNLRPRSVIARSTPKSADRSDMQVQRSHSVMGNGSIPIPHTMTRNMSRPVPPPSVASAKSRSELPPVDDLFPRPELEPRIKKYLVRVANETSNALIKDTLMQDEPGSVLWRPVPRPRGTSGNIHVLRGTASNVSKTNEATCVRAVSDDVHASIEEFALLFKLDSSREAADHLLLFNADLLRHSTLYTLVAPSGLQPRRYVGVKWALVASPSKLFRNRDFCYLECQKEFTDARGRRGWVRSLHSLKMPCCPSLEKEHGIVRASIYRSGLTAVETEEPGVLSVTYTVELDLKGRMALELLQPGFLAQRVAALATVDKLLQQQRLSSSPLLGDLDIPTKKRTRSSCNLCFREVLVSGGFRDTIAAITNMQTTSKRYICRKCGEGVCRRCSDDWLLDVPVVGRTKVRICTVCSAEAKQSHISVHTTRAGTCPIRRFHNEPSTEVEGITHPELLPPRARRRSLSMVDQPCDAASFFLQQEDIKRDLELRATELSRRVQLWDEMQVYNRDSGLLPGRQHPMQQEKSYQREQMKSVKREQSLSCIPLSKGVKKPEEEKKDDSKVSRHQQAQRVSTSDETNDKPHRHERLERYPSFLSSEVSSNQEYSDTEGEDVIRLTAEAGARLSSDYRDSDLSDYEEHTIDGLGEIRTTTDITRWWHDQQRVSETGEEVEVRPRANLSPVPSPRKKNSSDEGKSGQNPERADVFPSYWKKEATNDTQHQVNSQSVRQKQHAAFEEQAQYQQEQEARRRQHLEFEEQAQYQEEQARCRQESIESAVRWSESKQRQHITSALQQIQQRQKELERLRRNQQQLGVTNPSAPSGGDHVVLDSRSSVTIKERYLQQQRQQQMDVAAEKEARRKALQALDQTDGEDLELMETSQGEWVPTNEVRESKTKAEMVSGGNCGPGFCSSCGSPEYRSGNGLIKSSCKCCGNGAPPLKTAGTVLFDGKWISNPVLQEAS